MPQLLPSNSCARKLFLCFVLLNLIACDTKKKPKEVALYNQYCASCHPAPKINDLPKGVWKNNVLPKMAEMMEIEEMYRGLNTIDTVFRPKIKLMDWVLLSDYIIRNAPEQLESSNPSVKI